MNLSQIRQVIQGALRATLGFLFAVGLLAMLCAAKPQAQSLADLAREQQAKKAAAPPAKAQRVYTNDNLPHHTTMTLGNAPAEADSADAGNSAKHSDRPVEWKEDVNSFNMTAEEFRNLDREQLGQAFISKVDPTLVGQAFPERIQWQESLFAARQRFLDATNRYNQQWQSCQTSMAAGAGERQACLTSLEKARTEANQAKTDLYATAGKGQQAVRKGAPSSSTSSTTTRKAAPASTSAKPAAAKQIGRASCRERV